MEEIFSRKEKSWNSDAEYDKFVRLIIMYACLSMYIIRGDVVNRCDTRNVSASQVQITQLTFAHAPSPRFLTPPTNYTTSQYCSPARHVMAKINGSSTAGQDLNNLASNEPVFHQHLVLVGFEAISSAGLTFDVHNHIGILKTGDPRWGHDRTISGLSAESFLHPHDTLSVSRGRYVIEINEDMLI